MSVKLTTSPPYHSIVHMGEYEGVSSFTITNSCSSGDDRHGVLLRVLPPPNSVAIAIAVLVIEAPAAKFTRGIWEISQQAINQ